MCRKNVDERESECAVQSFVCGLLVYEEKFWTARLFSVGTMIVDLWRASLQHTSSLCAHTHTAHT